MAIITGGHSHSKDLVYRFTIPLNTSNIVGLTVLAKALRLSVTFCAHGVADVLAALWTAGVPEPLHVWNTEVCERALQLGRNHPDYAASAGKGLAGEIQARHDCDVRDRIELGLGFVCLKHGVSYPFGTEEAGSGRRTGSPHHVAARAAASAEVYLPQVAAAASVGLLNHLVQVEMPWTLTVARSSWHGVRISEDRCRQVLDAVHCHLPRLRAELRIYGIDDVRNHEQLIGFFESQNLLDHFRRGKGFDFNKDNLKACENKHPAIGKIRAARRLRDLRGNPVLSAGLASDREGRVHPRYTVLGAVSGRLTCKGVNVAGIGKVFRPLVIPAPGYGNGEADYSQIEVGVAGAYYGDDDLVQLFNSDDVYSAMAKTVYADRLAPDDLALGGLEFKEKFKVFRNKMKIVTLAIIYGLTPYGLACRLGTTLAEAETLRDLFLARFPVLREALLRSPAEAAARGYADSVSGLRRYRPVSGPAAKWENNWLVNHPVQASAATVFKTAGARLDKLYRSYGARLIVPLHDAFVFEAPLAKLDEVAELTSPVMIDAVIEWFPQLRPRVEINIVEPMCWNKDGHADSIDRWVANPLYTL